MNNKIIINASEIVTCSGFSAKKGQDMNDLGIIHGGCIVIEDGIIKAVGTAEILEGIDTHQYHVLDAKGRTITPGFVDPHTHFVFGGYREEEYSWRLRGDSYMDIMARGGGIVNSVKGTRKASEKELLKEGMKRLNAMMQLGVTTVEGKSGYGLDLETELKQLRVMKALNQKHPLDIVSTFLGAHAIPTDYKENPEAFIDYMIDEVLPFVIEEGVAEFCDIFCETGVFSIEQSRRLLSEAKAGGMKLKIHADEITPLGGAELAAELGAISADHLLQVSSKGMKDMAMKNVVATLLPCTAFSLKEEYAPAREIIDAGCAVALATDFNPGSCHTQSIPLVIALATIYMGMTTEETLTALTINAAAAIDRAHEIGSIDVGKKADLVLHDYASYKFIPYHIGMSTVNQVMKNGEIIYKKQELWSL